MKANCEVKYVEKLKMLENTWTGISESDLALSTYYSLPNTSLSSPGGDVLHSSDGPNSHTAICRCLPAHRLPKRKPTRNGLHQGNLQHGRPEVIPISPRFSLGLSKFSICIFCRLLAIGQWFSPSTPVSSTSETGISSSS